jgi:hypothetical protein
MYVFILLVQYYIAAVLQYVSFYEGSETVFQSLLVFQNE